MKTNNIENKIIDLVMEMKSHFIYGNNFISSAMLLRIIKENKESRVIDIAKKMNISAPSVTEALDKLEAKGFIKRQEGEDKREKIISITDKGDSQFKEIAKLMREEMKDKISSLKDEDKIILEESLASVTNILKKITLK